MAAKNNETPAIQVNKRKKKTVFLQWAPVYLMMLPGLLYLIINNYIPMAGLVIA